MSDHLYDSNLDSVCQCLENPHSKQGYALAITFNSLFQPEISQPLISSFIHAKDIAEISNILLLGVSFLDRLTAEHMARVGWIANELADKMGLDYGNQMESAAALHDIGKLLIPKPLLEMKKRIDSGYFQVYSRHTSLGYLLLDFHPDLGLARDIALKHHERWDGRGYPQRISGKNIPLSGRITAVADVFDALVSKRSYKLAYPVNKAADIMQEHQGIFDSSVLEAFLNGYPSPDKLHNLSEEYAKDKIERMASPYNMLLN